MTRKIIKVELPTEEMFELELPNNTEFLKLSKQHGKPILWLRIPHEPEEPLVKYPFQYAETGHTNSSLHLYVGTLENDEGEIVHLFMRCDTSWDEKPKIFFLMHGDSYAV